jgi:hypothetical protein
MKLGDLRYRTLSRRQLAFAYRVGLHYPAPLSVRFHPVGSARFRSGPRPASRPPPRREPTWLRLAAYGVVVSALALFAIGFEALAIALFGLIAVTWSVTGLWLVNRYRARTGEVE